MGEKNELHKLIHSLTPSEKAYFKKYAYKSKNDADNSYLLLFDAILKQEEYNEAALKVKLKHTRLLNNFSMSKSYLADLIIGTFTSLKESNSIENRLISIIQQFPFLLERRVHHLLKKKIKQAKQYIYTFELYSYFSIVYNYEIQILEIDKNYQTKKNKLNEEQNQINEKLQNIQLYLQLKDEWLMVRQDANAYIRAEGKSGFVSEKLLTPFLKDENNAITTASKILFYYIRAGYFLINNDVVNAYNDNVKLYHVLRSNPNYCKANEREYINALSNFILRMLNVNDYTYFSEIKIKMQQALADCKDTDLKQSKQLNIALVEKKRYLEKNQFTKIYGLLPDYFAAIKFYVKRHDIQLSLWYDAAIMCFYNDKFERCLECIAQILNHKSLHTMKDLESYSLLLRIFVFIEINQLHHFDTNIENLRRKLYRDDKLFKTENAILKMLVDYSVALSPAHKIELITKYKKNIEKILQDKLEQNIINYFPVILWLEAKLENKTIFRKFNQK